MEINDLIHDAISNALTRRGLVEEDACIALSDEEAARIAGGLTSEIKATKFSPIEPVSPPTKPISIKPICPPIIVGLIVQDYDKLA
jgi:hypothetical protein